jgi:hypothetical protein
LKRSAVAVVCLLISFGVIAPASLSYADPAVLNGSFEDPAYAPNSIHGGGGTFWTPGGTGNGSNVFILSNNYSNFGTTPFGNQYLGFTAPLASDQQTISGFLAGQSYVLDLFISDVANNSNPQLQVTLTGAANATGTFSAPQSQFLAFQDVQLPFTTTSSGNITLDLIDFGSASIAVDNVSIMSVPEPSAVFTMLLLTGILTTGAINRIRRRR